MAMIIRTRSIDGLLLFYAFVIKLARLRFKQNIHEYSGCSMPESKEDLYGERGEKEKAGEGAPAMSGYSVVSLFAGGER